MHLLERMDRTEYQLRTKLKRNADIPTDSSIGYILWSMSKDLHYIDDVRYAGLI